MRATLVIVLQGQIKTTLRGALGARTEKIGKTHLTLYTM